MHIIRLSKKNNSTTIPTTSTNAINKIQAVLNEYQGYITTIQSGSVVTFNVTPSGSPASAVPTGNLTGENNSPAGASVSTFQCGNTPSQCSDSSQATCGDGTPTAGVDCGMGDGSVSDSNGFCTDMNGTVSCANSDYECVCANGTPPC